MAWIKAQALDNYAVELHPGIIDTGDGYTGTTNYNDSEYGDFNAIKVTSPQIGPGTQVRITIAQWDTTYSMSAPDDGGSVGTMVWDEDTNDWHDDVVVDNAASGPPSLAPTTFEPSQVTFTASGSGSQLYVRVPRFEDGSAWWTLDLIIEVQVIASDTSYNCTCDDDYPRSTLAELRNRLARRLGFSVQEAMGALPPGMSDLLDDFIRQAQEVLYRRYSVFRMERWYTWDMVAGTRFYDLDANADACTKKLDPRKVTWCGISQGDDSWRPLVCGINPTMYTSQGPGIPSHYEIRQCIEVWPSPSDDTWKLRAKGYFGLQPLVADTDETTIDPEAIFLLALANAKAHYGQPDANNYASMATAYVRDLVRGQHHTRRYVPGECEPPPMVRPVPVGGWE